MTRRYPVPAKVKKPRKKVIPESLRSFYTPALEVIQRLQAKGLTLAEVCTELNRQGFRTRTGLPYQHPQQLIRILRSFAL